MRHFIKQIWIGIMFFAFSQTMYGQLIYYSPSPNYVLGVTEFGSLPFEINFQTPRLEVNAGYIFSENYFAMASVNFDSFTSTYNRGLFSSPRKREKNNTGFRIAAGRQNLGNIGNYKNLEVLVGVESQWSSILDYFERDGPEIAFNLEQHQFNIYAQFAMTKVAARYDFGYSVKLNYLKFTKIRVDDMAVFPSGEGNILVQPGIHYNRMISKDRKLSIISSFSLAIPLSGRRITLDDETIVYNVEKTLLRPVLAIGLRYVFHKKKGQE